MCNFRASKGRQGKLEVEKMLDRKGCWEAKGPQQRPRGKPAGNQGVEEGMVSMATGEAVREEKALRETIAG